MPDATAIIRTALTGSLRLVPGAVRVTVTRVNPDTGEPLDFALECWGKRTAPKRSPFQAGGGELGQEQCQWRVESDGVEFQMRVGDRVTEPDQQAWAVDGVSAAGLGTRFVCQCTRARG